MADYAVYAVTVSTLTPLHIGSGVDLLHEYDYAIHGGRTWRIDEFALLDAQDVADPAFADRLAQTPPAQLLGDKDFSDGSPFFRYVIDGTPRSSAEGAQVREQIKDTYDRPYLAGSSLKGALRTALAWNLWQVYNLRPEVRQLQRRKQWAASGYEKELFGRSPNYDLLRALQVSDSEAMEDCPMMIANVRVQDRAGNLKAPIEVEAVRPDVTFRLTMKIDQALFSDWAKRAEMPAQGAQWLSDLPQMVQRHTIDRVRRDLQWYDKIASDKPILQFYQTLEKARLGPNQCVLQLGWGTGWGSKTFGSRLQSDADFMDSILRDYRMARGRRRPGDPFPKSRRVSVGFARSRDGRISERPAPPLGWCLVEMKERQA